MVQHQDGTLDVGSSVGHFTQSQNRGYLWMISGCSSPKKRKNCGNSEATWPIRIWDENEDEVGDYCRKTWGHRRRSAPNCRGLPFDMSLSLPFWRAFRMGKCSHNGETWSQIFTELKHWVFSSGVGQSPNWKWCLSLPHVSAEDTREVVGTLADVAVGGYGSKCSASQMVDMVGIKYDKILHLGSSSVPTFGLSLRVDSQAEFTVQPGQCSIHE